MRNDCDLKPLLPQVILLVRWGKVRLNLFVGLVSSRSALAQPFLLVALTLLRSAVTAQPSVIFKAFVVTNTILRTGHKCDSADRSQMTFCGQVANTILRTGPKPHSADRSQTRFCGQVLNRILRTGPKPHSADMVQRFRFRFVNR
jgi:hypothetical protein